MTMSLYNDICRNTHASDDDLEFDADTQTWTVLEAWGADAIPGLPSKDLALAIARAIYAAYCSGSDGINYS